MISSREQSTSTNPYKETRRTFLYTIGYGMRSFHEIEVVLANYQIEQVADIRYNVYSENRDFNEDDNGRLSYAFWKIGITYIHRKELGNPPAIKRLFKTDKNLWKKKFFSRLTIEDRINLQGSVTHSVTALLCFEKNHRNCHRIEVARWIVKGTNPRIKVKHL